MSSDRFLNIIDLSEVFFVTKEWLNLQKIKKTIKIKL